VANALAELTATDCFDYFVNHFEFIYKNESKNRTNAVLDPDISTRQLYTNLQENYLSEILSKAEFQNLEVSFSRKNNDPTDYIIATFSFPNTDNKISIEFDRKDSTEDIAASFLTGIQAMKSTYAKEVIEMKSY
jgi:hypothetical protein